MYIMSVFVNLIEINLSNILYRVSFCFAGDPKNIAILGENNTILFAKSNHIVNLTCCVESGIPANETIIWMEEKIELSRGGPSVLTYTFTPNVEDHLLNFSCIVFTGTISLQTHIQLFLYCK